MTVEKWSPCPTCHAWGTVGKKRKKKCPECKGNRIVLVAIDGKPVKPKLKAKGNHA